MNDSNSKCLLMSFVIANTILTSVDTMTQIMHYSLTNWANDTIKNIDLMFLLFRPALYFTIFLLYVLLHCESIITIGKKFMTFGLFMLCMYVGYTPGVHISFFSKYYLDSENGIVIAKIVNAFTFVFVALPKLLIIPINSSAVGTWNGIDIVALIFSCLFIIFSIIYYFTCNHYDFQFEMDLEDISKLWEIPNTFTTPYNEEKEKINDYNYNNNNNNNYNINYNNNDAIEMKDVVLDDNEENNNDDNEINHNDYDDGNYENYNYNRYNNYRVNQEQGNEYNYNDQNNNELNEKKNNTNYNSNKIRYTKKDQVEYSNKESQKTENEENDEDLEVDVEEINHNKSSNIGNDSKENIEKINNNDNKEQSNLNYNKNDQESNEDEIKSNHGNDNIKIKKNNEEKKTQIINKVSLSHSDTIVNNGNNIGIIENNSLNESDRNKDNNTKETKYIYIDSNNDDKKMNGNDINPNSRND